MGFYSKIFKNLKKYVIFSQQVKQRVKMKNIEYLEKGMWKYVDYTIGYNNNNNKSTKICKKKIIIEVTNEVIIFYNQLDLVNEQKLLQEYKVECGS